MKMRFCLCFLVIGLLFASCDSRFKRLGKTDYYVGWINMPELTNIYLNDGIGYLGVANNRITDVYWNDQYILATQCKAYSDDIVGYYIIKMLPPVEKGVPWEKTGPLSKEEYEQKKQELHLDEKEMKHINLFD